MKKPKYTFIVNTYPSPKRNIELSNCLDSIFAQTFTSFKILLVENYENLTKIKPVVSYFQKRRQAIEVLNDPTKRLSHLFDIAWRAADTDFLAYVADDVVLERDWLTNVDKELESNRKIAVASGPVIGVLGIGGEMHRLYLAVRNSRVLQLLAWPYLHFAMEDGAMKPGKLFKSGAYSIGTGTRDALDFPWQEIDLATTSSMGIRRKVIKEVGGFDQRFNFNHADGDLFIKIKKQGYKIIFSPNVIAHHYLRMGPSRNAYIIGLDTGMFYKKNVRPDSFPAWLGAFLNIIVLNSYWVYSTVRTRDIKQLKGIFGFLHGFLISPL